MKKVLNEAAKVRTEKSSSDREREAVNTRFLALARPRHVQHRNAVGIEKRHEVRGGFHDGIQTVRFAGAVKVQARPGSLAGAPGRGGAAALKF